MRGRLPFILAFVVWTSCRDKTVFLLPKEYGMSKKQETISFPDKITIYEVVDEHIDYAKIKNYPRYDRVDHDSQKWINIDRLDEDDRALIKSIIEEISERVGEENEGLNGLVALFDQGSEIYFSGIYRKTKIAGNKTYNFYDIFNILDIAKSRLYHVEYIKDR